jgi:hypothetical protein
MSIFNDKSLKGVADAVSKIMETSNKEEKKFHNKLDKLVHKTFGHSPDEMKKEETEKHPFVAVHAKKGMHQTHGSTSYEAAQNAAKHWKMKNTAGIDVYRADKKHIPEEVEQIDEGRPSQRHPLEGHEYHKKSNEALIHIAKDAHKAAEAMKGHNTDAENKYRDQANDSATVRYFRQKSGMPDWYKKKYGHVKEEKESCEDEAEEAVEKHEKKMHGKKGEVSKHEKEMHKESFTSLIESYKKEGLKSLSKMKKEEVELDEEKKMKGEDPCWDSHEMVGMKMKDGKKVPNCVPKNEEVEQIDELSKETLRSYLSKARESVPKNYNQYEKRTKGIDKAKDKLIFNKEEVEQLDERDTKLGFKESPASQSDVKIGNHTLKHTGSEKNTYETSDRMGSRIIKAKRHNYDIHDDSGKKIGQITHSQHSLVQNYGFSKKITPAEHHFGGEIHGKKIDHGVPEGFSSKTTFPTAHKDERSQHTSAHEFLKSHLNVNEEVDSETFEKEMKDQKAKFDGKKKGGDVAKASVQAVKQEEVELDEGMFGKKIKRPDRYHITHKSGKPATLASYGDRDSAIKDRNEKYPQAEVHLVGSRGKIKAVEEVELEEESAAMDHYNKSKWHSNKSKDNKISDEKRIAHGDAAKFHMNAYAHYLGASRTNNDKEKQLIDMKKAKNQADAAKRIEQQHGLVEEVELEEAKKIISKHGDGVHTAKVYRDPEYNEYQVHYFKNGKHMGEDPVSYHDDKDDAQNTAEHEVKRMNARVNESLDEAEKITHKNPLVKVHDNTGLISHTSLSQANKDFGTKVSHKDIHDYIGPVVAHMDGKKSNRRLKFSLSPEHKTAMNEEIVKSMKKNLKGFKERYGERAKEVMHATATAKAKESA